MNTPLSFWEAIGLLVALKLLLLGGSILVFCAIDKLYRLVH
jgi:hypothetical protein